MSSKKDREESDKTKVEEAVRSPRDRAEDPLFVPHIEELEIEPRALKSDADRYAALLESICGTTDDSQPVEQYDGTLGVTVAFVAAHQSAACQVQWNNNLASIYTNAGNVSGVRWGSGTMISDDLFLTCGHLFDQTGGGWNRPRVNGTTNIISPQEIATNMRLNFNYQVDPSGTLRPEQSFPIVQLLEYRLGGLDMAICRIGGNPGSIFGRAAVSTTDAVSPDMICIIGHPAGQPKRIEAGPTTAIDGNLIRYNDIDTLGGNSGSGVLRSSDGRLVGIHTNGGCGPSSPGPTGGSNFGQRIAAVIAVSPTLQALVRPKLKVVDDPITLKFRDDGGSLKFIDDPIPKRKVVDDPITLKFRDDGGSIKILDDPVGPKRKVVDDPITLKFRDDGGSFKAIDDVKLPTLDKHVASDFPFSINPGRPPFEGSSRPFILSTPHHSNIWQGGGYEQAGGLAEAVAALMQYEEAMAAAEEQLKQLDSEYRQLLEQYEAMMRGGEGQ